MNFSKEDISTLQYCAENNIKIKIKGCNHRCQMIDVDAYIVNTSNSISNDMLQIHMCQKVDNSEQIIFAPFYTQDQGLSKSALYIKSIRDEYGNLIYKNPGFRQLEMTFANRIAIINSSLKTLSYDAKNLLRFLGKPIIFKNNKYILKAVIMHNGYSCIQATNGVEDITDFATIRDIKIDIKALKQLNNVYTLSV